LLGPILFILNTTPLIHLSSHLRSIPTSPTPPLTLLTVPQSFQSLAMLFWPN
jgi:hypothetical protein